VSDPRTAIRTLGADEREAVLALLDAWPLSSPLRGREFFRRFVERDPHYRDENFWVAAQDGTLVACVQIFPRRLRVGNGAVSTGGIGTVFTSEKARGSGLASALLACALDAMRARGMALSLLFASRHAFYGRLGWALWPRPRPLWLRSGAAADPEPGRRVDGFSAARDLDAVIALHERYSAPLAGTVVRDRAYWEGQLHFAGNPTEDFLVARDAAGGIEAYARGCHIDGLYFVSEIGRAEGAESAAAAADLVLRLSAPRDPDPIAAGVGRASDELRRVAVAPPLDDAPLAAALTARGIETKLFAERATMLRIVDSALLERSVGVSREPGESEAAYLARLLPPERFTFWAADRF
jgi:predicted N-acetyltransferase YhbS